MKIKSQDGRHYNIVKVYFKAHYYGDLFMGWNIYGESPKGRKYLLGTMDTDIEAHQIVNEIQKLMAKGISTYSIPEPVEEYEAEAIIAELEAKMQ